MPITLAPLPVLRAFVRVAAVLVVFLTIPGRTVFAQPLQLVFTAPLPQQAPPSADVRPSPAVEERGLALWAGTATDFGSGITIANPRWSVRGMSAMTTLRFDDRERPSFQQFELLHQVFSAGSFSVAGGGGVRQTWDGSRVFIGRVIGGSDFARGRLQGSLVVERAVSSQVAHDTADLLTTFGWSRPIGNRISMASKQSVRMSKALGARRGRRPVDRAGKPEARCATNTICGRTGEPAASRTFELRPPTANR